MDILNLVMRWTHIGAVIVIAGGAIFSRFVLSPAAAKLPDEHHDALRENVMGRWKRFVHVGILLLLVSGFYNYFQAMPTHRGIKLYHPIIGTKILLAFGVFFIASALVGRSEKFAPIRANAKLWQTILAVLIACIVALSGFAKVALPPQSPAGDVEITTPSPDN